MNPAKQIKNETRRQIIRGVRAEIAGTAGHKKRRNSNASTPTIVIALNKRIEVHNSEKVKAA